MSRSRLAQSEIAPRVLTALTRRPSRATSAPTHPSAAVGPQAESLNALRVNAAPERGVSGRRVDGDKQAVAGLVEGACRVVVAHGGGDGVELVEGGPRLEAGGGVGQRLELLVGGHDVGVGVAFADAALGIDFIDGEETGAVEVQVGGEDLLGEGVDAFSVTAGDVAVSEVLADDRAVLALDEGVVVAAAGSGLGELVDVEGLQPGGDFVVDELRTVVGVESADVEGERPEQGFEDGGEAGRVDALDRADELELGDLVDEVEVVEALDAVEVSPWWTESTRR